MSHSKGYQAILFVANKGFNKEEYPISWKGFFVEFS